MDLKAGVDSWQRQGVFIFVTASKLALRLTQLPIHWIPWALSLVEKCSGGEAVHPPAFSAEAKNASNYTSIPHMSSGSRTSQAYGQLLYLPLPFSVTYM